MNFRILSRQEQGQRHELPTRAGYVEKYAQFVRIFVAQASILA
ncbi:MAG: hypothetical protein AAF541_16235 [Pseudomonadota bacterium]